MIRKSESEWREKRWIWHGKNVYKDLQEFFDGKKFSLQDVSQLPALDHLAPSTAYDTSSAVCSYMEHAKMIRRMGTYFELRKSNDKRIKPSTKKKSNSKNRKSN